MRSQERKAILITLGVSVIIGIIVYSLYRNYSHKKLPLALQANPQKIIQNDHSNQLTFIHKSIIPITKAHAVQYLEITGGMTRDAMKTLNEELYETAKSNSCYIEQTSEDLQGEYLSKVTNDKNQKEVNAMTREQLISLLESDYGYYSSSDQELEDVSTSTISIVGSYGNYCGGAHPNAYTDGTTFSRKTGNPVTFKDFFKDIKKNESAIIDVMAKTLEEDAEQDRICNYRESLENGEFPLDTIKATLTKDGVRLYYFGYNHAMAACEPAGVLIPLSKISSLLRKE